MDDGSPIVGLSVKPFNWRLRRAREAKGWSRRDLARASGLDATTVGNIEALARRPSEAAAEKLSLVLEVAAELLFPDALLDLGQSKRPELEVPLDEGAIRALDGRPRLPMLEDPAEAVADDSLRHAVETALQGLQDRERQVLTLLFGLDRGERRTLDEVGQMLGVTGDRIRQVEARALRRLRHPDRSKALRPFVDDGWEEPRPLRGAAVVVSAPPRAPRPGGAFVGTLPPNTRRWVALVYDSAYNGGHGRWFQVGLLDAPDALRPNLHRARFEALALARWPERSRWTTIWRFHPWEGWEDEDS
jgi:RNA polymerase sigma factor (sigma-70 family)